MRELAEEVALPVPHEALRHVWHQEVISSTYSEGWDGAVLDYFLGRCDALAVAPDSTPALLQDEGITEFRWWSLDQLHDAPDEGLFRPHRLPALLGDLLAEPAGSHPIVI